MATVSPLNIETIVEGIYTALKTYSGTYKPNTSKYKGDPTNVVYRSLWELHCFKWCDSNSAVTKWNSEEIIIPYLYEVDNRYHRYFMDLYIEFNNGTTMLVEVKPLHQTTPPKASKRKTKRYISESLTYVKNINKWSAAYQYANDRGWKFEIWTEKQLTEMNILPKSTGKVPGKLKGMKPYKPYRKPSKK